MTTSPNSPTTPSPPPVAELRYDVTDIDRNLIGYALSRFAVDYRYLLDMVTAAGKADRASAGPVTPVAGLDHDLSAAR